MPKIDESAVAKMVVEQPALMAKREEIRAAAVKAAQPKKFRFVLNQAPFDAITLKTGTVVEWTRAGIGGGRFAAVGRWQTDSEEDAKALRELGRAFLFEHSQPTA